MSSINDKTEDMIHSVVNFMGLLETEKAETSNPVAVPTVSYNETEQTIVDMLQENTGAHILDSGGAYGRAWQRNRKIKDFKALPELHVKISQQWGIELNIDIFKYLTNFLELTDTAKQFQAEFEAYKNAHPDNWELTCMEEFADLKNSEDTHNHTATNTYNYENALAGTLQYVLFSMDEYADDTYIILQIHGGCDVRGGYTDAKIFKVNDWESFLMAQADLYANCDCEWCMGTSDDAGYKFQTETPTVKENENLGHFIKKLLKIPVKEVPFNERYTITDDNKCVCKKCHSEVRFSTNFY